MLYNNNLIFYKSPTYNVDVTQSFELNGSGYEKLRQSSYISEAFGLPNNNDDVKLISFADLFVACGYSVTVLNRYSPASDNPDEKIERNFDIVELISHRKAGVIGGLLFLMSIVIEFIYLIRYRIRNRKENVVLHLYTGHFFDILFY